MCQTNFLSCDKVFLGFFTTLLWSHNSAWGRKKILFSLSPTPLFILQSFLSVIRLYSEIDRRGGIKGEKEDRGKGREMRNWNEWQNNWYQDDLQQIKIYIFLCIRTNKSNRCSCCSFRIMLPKSCLYLLPPITSCLKDTFFFL